MRVRALAQYLQIKMEQDLVKASRDEAIAATAAAITAARADAVANGQDPDRAEALVPAVRMRSIDADVPTLEWCKRMAVKHGPGAGGVEIELHDPIRALELIGKNLGLFQDTNIKVDNYKITVVREGDKDG